MLTCQLKNSGVSGKESSFRRRSVPFVVLGADGVDDVLGGQVEGRRYFAISCSTGPHVVLDVLLQVRTRRGEDAKRVGSSVGETFICRIYNCIHCKGCYVTGVQGDSTVDRLVRWKRTLGVDLGADADGAVGKNTRRHFVPSLYLFDGNHFPAS